MSKLFISHSSKNNFHAIAIQNWLIAQGWDDLFLDIDPERGIVAGQRWEKALHDAANRCDTVLFLISQDWLDSEWCIKEFRLAKSLNKRIVGILIEDIAIKKLPEELTSTWQLTNLARGNDHETIQTVHPHTGEEQHVRFSLSGLARLKSGLIKAGLDPMFYQWPPSNDPERSPYRGMLPLEAEDAGIFFGREAPTNELLAKLRGLRKNPSPRFMVVLGASGAGKSSFMRAGVLPRLARDEQNFLTLPIIRPEQEVLWGENGLLACLAMSSKKYKLGINRAIIRQHIENNSEENNPKKNNYQELIKLLQNLSKTAKPVRLPGETNTEAPTLVMTIDQGEELFNSEGIEQSQVFLEMLKQLATQQQLLLIIVFTIRSDSYEKLQTHKSLEGISQQTFSLAPMPQGAYKSIIEEPAKRLKDSERELIIDPALTQKLLEDLEKGGNKDALPLLAFTLERLYIIYGDDGDLRLDEYQHMDGIEGAIQAAVDIALKDAKQDPLLPNDKQAIENLLRRGLIPWLAGIDPDSQAPKRRVAKLSEIPTEARPIIKHLIEQRLLATDTDEDNETTIEPAHESLLRQWGLLKGWLKEDLAILTTLEAVQRASRDWAANNQSQDYLAHNAGRLQDAEQLKQRDDIFRFLTQNDWEYLKQCRELENQQRDKELAEAKKLAQSQKQEVIAQKKVAKRTTMGMIAALVLSLVAGFMGWQSYKAEQLAEKNAQLAIKAKEESKEQLVEANHNYGLALFEKAKHSASKQSFHKASFFSANALLKLKEGKDKVKVSSLLLKNINQYNAIWTSPELGLPPGLETIAISPDGKTFTSSHSYWPGTFLRDIVTGKQIATFEGHVSAFSPDGKTLATATHDDGISLWDINTGLLKSVLARRKGSRIANIVFLPNGKTLATLANGGDTRLWDIKTGIEKKILSGIEKKLLDGYRSHVNSFTISPDGKFMAICMDEIISLWDLTNDKLYSKLQGHIGKINSVAFSPDGKTLASAGWDQSIRLWDVEKGQQKAVFSSHSSIIQQVVFSPNGKVLASGSGGNLVNSDSPMSDYISKDNTVRLWNIKTKKQIAVLEGHSQEICCIAFTPDSDILISGSRNGEIRIWNVSNNIEQTVLHGHSKRVTQVSYSPDGKTIASSGSFDMSIRLWDTITGNQIGIIEALALNVIFSSDNNTLASISLYNKIYLWNVATGKVKTILESHSDRVTSIAFSPDGKTLAAISEDNTISLWDIETGMEQFFNIGNSPINSIAYSPDGKFLATGSFGRVQVWGLKNKKLIINLDEQLGTRGYPSDDSKIVFSPNSKFLASISINNEIYLWDITLGEKLASFNHHSTKINDIAFSQDGKTIASASWDNMIHLWNYATGKVQVLEGHSHMVNSISFSPDGKTLASGSTDKTIRLWDLQIKSHLLDNKENLKQWIAEQEKFIRDEISGLEQPILNLDTLKEFVNPNWPKNHPFHWLTKAENGDAEAMLQLGIIYHQDSDNKKAKQWYTKALEAGHPQAQQRLDILELTSKFDNNNKEK